LKFSEFLDRHTQRLPVFALLLATFFWGSSFYSTSQAIAVSNPVTVVMARFAIGAVLVGLMLGRRVFSIPRSTWKAGAVCGVIIFLGYATNAAGLITLPSSKVGFLTALYVPLTPFFVWVVYGKPPSKAAFLGVALAFAGLILIADPANMDMDAGWGTWITVFSAFLSAAEIIVVDAYAPKTEPRELAFAQLVSVTVLSAAALPLLDLIGVPLADTHPNATFWIAVVWLAVIVALVQVILSWAQRYVPPAQAAVIFAMESVFAAVIGALAGERLGVMGLAGGALIVAGILAGEIKFRKKEQAL
jgi:drug/metabolite transporter (DMT)-like permease